MKNIDFAGLGLNENKVNKALSEYEDAYLTPELDKESFEIIISDILIDLVSRIYFESKLPMSLLSHWEGTTTFNGLKRPFSSRVIRENIIPFFVVNHFLNVFYVEVRYKPHVNWNNLNTSYKEDYIITFNKYNTEQVKEALEETGKDVKEIKQII